MSENTLYQFGTLSSLLPVRWMAAKQSTTY